MYADHNRALDISHQHKQ